jgi:hypothetical protein
MTASSSGLDLMAAVSDPVTLARGAIILIPTGLAVSIPAGYEAQIRPRSGLALKKGLTIINSPGTIDADYRGEIGVAMVNLGPETWSSGGETASRKWWWPGSGRPNWNWWKTWIKPTGGPAVSGIPAERPGFSFFFRRYLPSSP